MRKSDPERADENGNRLLLAWKVRIRFLSFRKHLRFHKSAMLRAIRVRPTQKRWSTCLRQVVRFESTDLGWNDIKTIRASKWPIIKGEATAEKTKLVKSHYLKKRLVNVVPKWVSLCWIVTTQDGVGGECLGIQSWGQSRSQRRLEWRNAARMQIWLQPDSSRAWFGVRDVDHDW